MNNQQDTLKHLNLKDAPSKIKPGKRNPGDSKKDKTEKGWKIM